jgi:DNA-binding NtrC family response regulator
MQEVYGLIDRVAATEAAVLVVGESGCGKELVASTIHDRSGRRDGPFVAVNCGAIPANLIEAELFGYEKGAFTGAMRQHRGYFERAAGGTLFLDEITEMAPAMQVRLLRVLESGRYTRVGGDQELVSGVRIVSATNRDPVAAVRDGHLREDLMYRLAVFPIRLPPLRDRGDDVEQLALHFLDDLNRENGTSKRLSRAAAAVLRVHPWPGNVRELRNAIQRAYIVCDQEIELEAAAPCAAARRSDLLQFPLGTSIAEMERAAILATLAHTGGDKKRCAELLGVSVKTLYNRLTSYGARRPAPVAG